MTCLLNGKELLSQSRFSFIVASIFCWINTKYEKRRTQNHGDKMPGAGVGVINNLHLLKE
jgi:hypothetical protein